MRKTVFLLFLMLATILSSGQFVNNQGSGSSTTLYTFQGAMKSTFGIVNGRFTDTVSANLTPIKFYPGAQIVTGNIFWVRNSTATAWLMTGSLVSVSAGNLAPLFTTNVANPTTAPAITFTLNAQAPNTGFLGPPSGPPATPTFRTLVAADLTGDNGSPGDILRSDGIGGLSWINPSGGGTVFNFSSGNLPPLFTTSVNTANTTPVQSFSLNNQSANLFFGGPISGGSAAPTFRSITSADLPLTSPYGLQKTIDASAVLNKNNTISGSGYDFVFNSIDTMWLNGTGLSQRAVLAIDSGMYIYRMEDAGQNYSYITTDIDRSLRLQSLGVNAAIDFIPNNPVGGFIRVQETFFGGTVLNFFTSGASSTGAIGNYPFTHEFSIRSVGDDTLMLYGPAKMKETVVSSSTGDSVLVVDANKMIRTRAQSDIAGGGGGSGVTSVGLSLPSIFTISGSPVTATGTLTGALSIQTANLIFSGPATGAAAAPTFRALVLADMPSGFITTLGVIGSTPNANAATLTGNTLNLELASTSFGGLWGAGTQSLAGSKTIVGNMIFQPTVSTGTGSTSGLQVAANSLTSGHGVEISSTSISSGNLVSISVTSASASGNSQTSLSVINSGANTTASQTTYGATILNAKSGTSSINYALTSTAINAATAIGGYFTATGGTNSYALITGNGFVGINTPSPLKQFHSVGAVRHETLGSTVSDSSVWKPAVLNSSGDLMPFTFWPGDNSVTNEIQTFANTSASTTHTLTLSNSGGSIQFVEGSGVTLTTSGTSLNGIVTIASTGGGVSGDLGYTASPTNGIVTNTGGTDATIPLVTPTNAGLMSPAEAARLDSNSYINIVKSSGYDSTAWFVNDSTLFEKAIDIDVPAWMSVSTASGTNDSLLRYTLTANPWSSGVDGYALGIDYARLFTRQTISNPTGTWTFNVNSGGQGDVSLTATGGRTLAFSNHRSGDIVLFRFNNTSGSTIVLTLPSNSFLDGTSASTLTVATGRSQISLSGYDGTNYFFTQGGGSDAGLLVYQNNTLYTPSINGISEFGTGYNIFLGDSAGVGNSTGQENIFLGREAGYQSFSTTSIYIGSRAGQGTEGSGNIIMGDDAGLGSTNVENVIFMGVDAGGVATNALNSIFIGYDAGFLAANAIRSVFMGTESGTSATDADRSIFIGDSAGYSSENTRISVLIGRRAGMNAPNSMNSIFIGDHAGDQSGGNIDNNNLENDYSIIVGRYAYPGGFKNSVLIGGSIDSTAYIANTKDNQFMLAPNITELRWRSLDYTLPSSQAAGVLTNDGSGGLTWAAVAIGSVSSVTGTANQITASPTTGAVTLSIPSVFSAPGTITSASTLTVTSGGATITAGGLTVTAGGALITAGGLTVTVGTITFTPLNSIGVVFNSAAGVLSTYAATNHALQVGNATGQIANLGTGTAGQFLVSGGSSADPSWGSNSITINSTAISSGTAGRVLFQNSSNQVSQSSSLFWDESNTCLSLGGYIIPGSYVDLGVTGVADFGAGKLRLGDWSASGETYSGGSIGSINNQNLYFQPAISSGLASVYIQFGYYNQSAWYSAMEYANVSSGFTTLKLVRGGGGVAIGMGTTLASSKLNIGAGTATANTAPLKFTSGTNLTNAEAGAMEWDGTSLFITQTTGPARKTIAYTTDFKLSSILAATTTNSINSVDNTQTWSWNSLTTTGFAISTTTTASSVEGSYLFRIDRSGANASSSTTTYSAEFTNTHTGSTSKNIGLSLRVSGATDNQALVTDNGNVLIGGLGSASPATGNKTFSIFTGTAPTGSVVDGIVLYSEDVSSSAKLKLRDEAGNVGQIVPMLTATTTLDFGSTVAGTSTDLTLTVTGAADGDPVSIGIPNGSTLSNGVFTAWVSAANTITIRFSNNSLAATLDPASGTFRATVFKH